MPKPVPRLAPLWVRLEERKAPGIAELLPHYFTTSDDRVDAVIREHIACAGADPHELPYEHVARWEAAGMPCVGLVIDMFNTTGPQTLPRGNSAGVAKRTASERRQWARVRVDVWETDSAAKSEEEETDTCSVKDPFRWSCGPVEHPPPAWGAPTCAYDAVRDFWAERTQLDVPQHAVRLVRWLRVRQLSILALSARMEHLHTRARSRVQAARVVAMLETLAAQERFACMSTDQDDLTRRYHAWWAARRAREPWAEDPGSAPHCDWDVSDEPYTQRSVSWVQQRATDAQRLFLGGELLRCLRRARNAVGVRRVGAGDRVDWLRRVRDHVREGMRGGDTDLDPLRCLLNTRAGAALWPPPEGPSPWIEGEDGAYRTLLLSPSGTCVCVLIEWFT